MDEQELGSFCCADGVTPERAASELVHWQLRDCTFSCAVLISISDLQKLVSPKDREFINFLGVDAIDCGCGRTTLHTRACYNSKYFIARHD